MATNFFERQEMARRKTGRLIFFFILAVVTLVLLAYGLVMVIFAGMFVAEEQAFTLRDLWVPEVFLVVAVAVLLLVGGASAMKISELAAGGSTVAMMMGGREVLHQTKLPREKRLLNIVEEMSIASGVPMPRVYVLPDEAGINAFAAGYSTGDAVVAVSQGALEYLNRDELQGVVAHEFSHILNGDMRLNIRLIGIVYGILAVALLGRLLLHIGSRSRPSSSNKKGGGGALVLLGLGLYILGIGGVFFGNLIKAAVSRQREFLADASAVQFTRNPDGIGGALKKIGGLAKRSIMDHVETEEISHMFFADALIGKRFVDWFATHPPLPDRIRAIDPRWDGTYPKVEKLSPLGDEAVTETRPAKAKTPSILPGISQPAALPGLPQVPLPVLAAAAEVGLITPAGLAHAAALTDQIPEPLRAAAGEPYGARAVVLVLLLDPREEVRRKQINQLQAHAEQPLFRLVFKLATAAQDLPEVARFPLVELAMPALRQMSRPQFDRFAELVDALIRADDHIDLLEYMLRTVVLETLAESFGLQSPPRLRHRTFTALMGPVRQVLAHLAWEGAQDEPKAASAYDAGMTAYCAAGPLVGRAGLAGMVSFPPLLRSAECTLAAFDAALRECRDTLPILKEKVIAACTATILHDELATVRELELLRTVAAVLGCPMPPVAAGPASTM